MKNILMIILMGLFICTPCKADDVKKLSLDDIATLGLTIQSDASVKVEGNGSIRISTLWPTTICLGEVTGLDIENAKLIYQASLAGLGNLSRVQGKYAEAEPLLDRALAIAEGLLGPDDPGVASALNNRGVMRIAAGNYEAGVQDFAAALEAGGARSVATKNLSLAQQRVAEMRTEDNAERAADNGVETGAGPERDERAAVVEATTERFAQLIEDRTLELASNLAADQSS